MLISSIQVVSCQLQTKHTCFEKSLLEKNKKKKELDVIKKCIALFPSNKLKL